MQLLWWMKVGLTPTYSSHAVFLAPVNRLSFSFLFLYQETNADSAHMNTYTQVLKPAILSADTGTKADCCILLMYQLNVQITVFTAAKRGGSYKKKE